MPTVPERAPAADLPLHIQMLEHALRAAPTREALEELAQRMAVVLSGTAERDERNLPYLAHLRDRFEARKAELSREVR